MGTKSPIKKELTLSKSPSRRENKTLERSTSRQSVTSVSSEKSCGSNFRRRTMRLKEIDLENKKIATRIMHPKMTKDMDYLKLCKFY